MKKKEINKPRYRRFTLTEGALTEGALTGSIWKVPEQAIYETLAELRKILEEIKSPQNYSEDGIGNIDAPKEFWIWLKKEHPEVWEEINSEPSSALTEYFEWLAEKALVLLGK